MKPDYYIDAVLHLSRSYRKYRAVNEQLASLANNEGYPTKVYGIDSPTESHFVRCLDDALFILTGHTEIATLHLHEMPSHGCDISYEDGTEYHWENDEEFREAVTSMVEKHATEKQEQAAEQFREAVISMVTKHTTKKQERPLCKGL